MDHARRDGEDGVTERAGKETRCGGVYGGGGWSEKPGQRS